MGFSSGFWMAFVEWNLTFAIWIFVDGSCGARRRRDTFVGNAQ